MKFLKWFKLMCNLLNKTINEPAEFRDKEEKMQYLQFIQDVITRHNSNSFKLKEFTIAIIVAIFGIYVAKENIDALFTLIPAISTLALWFLDTVYLKQEKQYRELYKDAVLNKIKLYDMDASKYKICYIEVWFSETMRIFYLPLFLIVMAIFLYFQFCK